jgi:hypothetical protein
MTHMASVGRSSLCSGQTSEVQVEDAGSSHCWLPDAPVIIAKVLNGKTRDRAIAAAVRTFALLGKNPKGCSGSEVSDSEVASRLHAVEPVLKAKLNGHTASPSKKAMRNVAMHNFDVSFADGDVHQGNATSVQRGGRALHGCAPQVDIARRRPGLNAHSKMNRHVHDDVDPAVEDVQCAPEIAKVDASQGFHTPGPLSQNEDAQADHVKLNDTGANSVDAGSLKPAQPGIYDFDAPVPLFPTLNEGN